MKRGLAAVFSGRRLVFATLFDDATSALTNKPNGESRAVAKITPPLHLDNEAARVHHLGGRCNERLGLNASASPPHFLWKHRVQWPRATENLKNQARFVQVNHMLFTIVHVASSGSNSFNIHFKGYLKPGVYNYAQSFRLPHVSCGTHPE